MVQHKHERNPGTAFDVNMISNVYINRPAIIRRAATHKKRRCVKKATQIGWLRLVSLIDLTTLAGNDSESNVHRLCFKGKRPLRNDFIEKLNLKDKNVTVGAICVYPNRVAEAKKALNGTNINIASVAAGFQTENKD